MTRRLQKLLEALDAPSAADLRLLRSVRSMEMHGSAAARELLREWSEGTPGLILTEAARAALERQRR
jgi:hypothetical protein